MRVAWHCGTVAGNPNCLVAGTVKGMKETLQRHNEVLEQIQKSLEVRIACLFPKGRGVLGVGEVGL